MIRLPFLAGGVALYLGVRFLSRRRGKNVVRLRDGRRVRLRSSVALLSGSSSDLLALEYITAIAGAPPEELRLEARGLVQIVGSRAEFAACRSAVVTAVPVHLTFSFRRADAGTDWYPTTGAE